MILNKILYNPFIRTNDSTPAVMMDVILALLPCIVMSWVAYGAAPLMVVLIAIGSALLTEFIFSSIFFKNTTSICDGSAIVTAILLAFTLGPFTPLHIVAFGAASAVLFGKLLWGGLGRNVFNPALVGREFMTIFFPVIMSSGFIWRNKEAVNIEHIFLFDNDFISSLFFRVSGSIGEYSIFFLVLGGIYLLLRKRISWHIPVSLLAAFSLFMLIFMKYDITFSWGGLFLGAIYMATDMPTSSSTKTGKLYFGSMIGILCIIYLINDINHGYFSYAILSMNAFVQPVNWVFRPRVWGKKAEYITRFWQAGVLTVIIVLLAYFIIYLERIGGIEYLIYLLIVYCILKFILDMKGNKKIR